MRILVPVDGSDNALRAVRYAVSARDLYREPVDIHLINVQRRVASGGVRMFIPQPQLNDFYQEEGEAALKSARALLDAAGVPYHAHIAVGEEPESIARYAREHDCQLVVMGTRGMGTIANMLLGSVSSRTIHLSPVPVLLVK
jgi:nucleotide-binding universal stress UspA family protein